jgi:hypothetical protein
MKKDSKESQKQRKKELTKNLQGPFTIKRTTGTKVGVLTKDCIFTRPAWISLLNTKTIF